MPTDYTIYIVYFLNFVSLIACSIAISQIILLFFKHLGYPQSKKTQWYLAGVIFFIIFNVGFLIYAYRRLLFQVD